MYDRSNAHSRSSLAEAVTAGRRTAYGLIDVDYEPVIEGRWSRGASLSFIAASSTTLWTLMGLALIRIM